MLYCEGEFWYATNIFVFHSRNQIQFICKSVAYQMAGAQCTVIQLAEKVQIVADFIDVLCFLYLAGW